MTWQFTLSGFLIGALVGMTGMGGGSLLTPILVIFFGFKPTLAVGTDILHGAIFKSFGAGRHRKLGTVHGHLVLWMFLGSGPMSLLGVAFALVGLGFIGYGYLRQKQVDEALARGGYAPLDDRAALVFAACGIVLGAATLILVVAGQ